MNFDDEHTIHESRSAAERRARDFDDLQNEMAGNVTGRVSRFLPPEAAGASAADKRRTERAEALTRLQLMVMANPEYAALYRDTMNGLRETQNDLDRLRERALRLLGEEDDAIAAIDARAARDSKGQPVFRDRNGEVRYADGERVPDEESDTILWRGDEPGFEERCDHAERRERIAEVVADIDAGQAEIGEMQERLEDSDNPPSAEELQGIDRRRQEIAESLELRMSEAVSKPVDPATPTVASARPGLGLAIPEL
jgi:hypothetical protein